MDFWSNKLADENLMLKSDTAFTESLPNTAIFHPCFGGTRSFNLRARFTSTPTEKRFNIYQNGCLIAADTKTLSTITFYSYFITSSFCARGL